jgi:hypothetical protein
VSDPREPSARDRPPRPSGDPEADLERALGRSLVPADRGSIDSLNEVPDSLLAQARQLDDEYASALLEYHTRATRHQVRSFVADVVRGGAVAADWRRGGALVRDVSLREQLLQPLPALIAPLGVDIRHRLVPSLQSWQAGVSWVGAPVLLVPDADYRTVLRPGVVRLLAPSLEPAPDIVVCGRRWIAARMARSLMPATPHTIAELAARLASASMTEWSADAKAAAEALVREFRSGSIPPDAIPGFRGSDAWYRSVLS